MVKDLCYLVKNWFQFTDRFFFLIKNLFLKPENKSRFNKRNIRTIIYNFIHLLTNRKHAWIKKLLFPVFFLSNSFWPAQACIEARPK